METFWNSDARRMSGGQIFDGRQSEGIGRQKDSRTEDRRTEGQEGGRREGQKDRRPKG
jgi:hypothetical protein